MEPIVDHIEITVRDMKVAVPFYDRLLPLLGFDPRKRGEAVLEPHEKHVVQYEHPRLGFAITSPRKAHRKDAMHRRRPGALHHLAFRVDSRVEVDRLHAELVRIGANVVSPPREYPEYTPPRYYAVFFKDPEGIKYEIVCHSGSETRKAGPADSRGTRRAVESRRGVKSVERRRRTP